MHGSITMAANGTVIDLTVFAHSLSKLLPSFQAKFVSRSVTDSIEVRLRDLVETMTKAWQKGACGPECSLGNMTALAGAILAFYQEQPRNIHDHWSNYRAR